MISIFNDYSVSVTNCLVILLFINCSDLTLYAISFKVEKLTSNLNVILKVIQSCSETNIHLENLVLKDCSLTLLTWI